MSKQNLSVKESPKTKTNTRKRKRIDDVQVDENRMSSNNKKGDSKKTEVTKNLKDKESDVRTESKSQRKPKKSGKESTKLYDVNIYDIKNHNISFTC